MVISIKSASTESVNPFPNKPLFLRVCSTSHLKTLWKKKKLLVTSNFSFSNSVFYSLGEFFVIFNCLLETLCVWKSLNLSFGKAYGLKHCRKRRFQMLVIGIFSFPTVFYPITYRSCHLNSISHSQIYACLLDHSKILWFGKELS